MDLEKIRKAEDERMPEVEERLQEFSELKDANEYRLFKELIFVILTSQTSAKKAWEAAEQLERHGLILEGDETQIAEVLQENEVQYEQNKASYIVQNMQKLSQPTLQDPTNELKISNKIDDSNLEKTRRWMVENLQGVGWKGASHFLRNIGYGDIAIVSNYIAEDLYELGLTEEPSQPSNEKEYLEAEEKMKELAEKLDLSVEALDLVLWSMETGEVFK